MTLPMFILSANISGLQAEIRVNDIRLYVKRDAVPARFTARLNPWMLPDVNSIVVRARLAPNEPEEPGKPVPEKPETKLSVVIQRGVQGEPLPEGPGLLQFTAPPEQLSTLGAGRPAVLLQQAFNAGPLPWQNPWQQFARTTFGVEEVSAYLEDYLQALRRRDLAWIIEANRLRSLIAVNTLGITQEAMNEGYASRLASVEPDQWTLVDPRRLAISLEGDGRVCRVETVEGGPVILAGGADGPGMRFMLARASGRLWVVG